MSIPPGLVKLLGKIQAMRNPAFTNRELAALSTDSTSDKLIPWAAKELQKPFSQPMTRRGFFDAVGSIPGKAKKMELFTAVPEHQRLRNELDGLDRTFEHLMDPADVPESMWDDPEVGGYLTSAKDYHSEDYLDNLQTQYDTLSEQLDDPRFDALRQAFTPDNAPVGSSPLDIQQHARKLLQGRLEEPNPHPHPYDIPWDHPERKTRGKAWEDFEYPMRDRANAQEIALRQAMWKDFDAVTPEDVLQYTPAPSPAVVEPPAPPAPETPQGPSVMDRYKKRFGIR